MGASIVASVDAPPVLEPAEHDLDLMALAIKDSVVRDGCFSLGARGDAGGNAPDGEGFSEPVGVVALVGQQKLGRRKCRQHEGGTIVVAHLSL